MEYLILRLYVAEELPDPVEAGYFVTPLRIGSLLERLHSQAARRRLTVRPEKSENRITFVKVTGERTHVSPDPRLDEEPPHRGLQGGLLRDELPVHRDGVHGQWRPLPED